MSVTTELSAVGIGERFGHGSCVMCGANNPWSLGVSFEPDGEGGVKTNFTPTLRLQGYDGMLHGGVSAALLDSAMTHCLFHRGVRAVTGELRVRYMHPVPCDEILNIKARVTEETPPLYRLKAELALGGRELVRAQATFCESPTSARSDSLS